MQSSSDLQTYLEDSIAQLETRLKEFKTRAETKKGKKGSSKNDASKRSAEQVDEHRRMLLRLVKLSKDTQFENDNVFESKVEIDYQRIER